MANACGVDFGTSNSTVGFSRADQPSLLMLEDGKPTLPSVVFFNGEEESVSFGRAALAEYLCGTEGRLMRSLKSLLGTSMIEGQTEVLGHAVPFRALLAQFIGELKRRSEEAAGQRFDLAVFGRPVFFIDGNEEADMRAEDTLEDIALAAGYEDVAFQYEPIAAAFDYESRIDREELVLVVDIGGGTSDFSLIRVGPQQAKKTDRRGDILATGGVHLGGTDFDKYLSLSSVMPLLGLGSRLKNNIEVPSSTYFNLATWHTINLAYTRKAESELQDLCRDATERSKLERLQRLIKARCGHWLALQIEQGKIALSDAEQAQLDLDRLEPPEQLMLRREEFNHAASQLVSTIEQTVLTLFQDAGVTPDQVESVFFTGGSSGVPALRQRVAALVPGARLIEGDLFGSIGAGLALDAVRRFG